jgi:hypothetical protein
LIPYRTRGDGKDAKNVALPQSGASFWDRSASLRRRLSNVLLFVVVVLMLAVFCVNLRQAERSRAKANRDSVRESQGSGR